MRPGTRKASDSVPCRRLGRIVAGSLEPGDTVGSAHLGFLIHVFWGRPGIVDLGVWTAPAAQKKPAKMWGAKPPHLLEWF